MEGNLDRHSYQSHRPYHHLSIMRRIKCCEASWDTFRLSNCPRCHTRLRKIASTVPEHPTILEIDEEAQATLEIRRLLAQPDTPGWWRNAPNPHAVGHQLNDDEL